MVGLVRVGGADEVSLRTPLEAHWTPSGGGASAYPRLVPDQDPPVRVRVLGPVLLEQARTPTAAGPPKQRALLAALALHLGSAIPVDTLADLLWGDDVPGAVNASLPPSVAGLGRLLEP